MNDVAPVSSPTPELLCELCRRFYELGWASGTGGGISIRDGAGIWIAPSGVQKERIAPGDLFLVDAASLDRPAVLRRPAAAELRISECTPLFLNAYRLRGAGAVLHAHSVWAVLAARLFSPHGVGSRFVSHGLEMQKGLRRKGCFDEVRIPIIPNTARESELTETMAEAMEAHPDVDAVIVAGHGFYAWGRDWVEAKTQAECLDWLFRAAVEAHRLGLPITGLGS
jgi:methylthioribulose-1-phosphate dehydratase